VRDECGGERWIEATWSVETGPDGQPQRIFSTRLDITKTVESRNDLAKAKVEAERASETKSRFLAAASHDLRQPVQSLILLIALIKQQAADNRKIDHAFYLAETSVKSLNEMLMVLLDMSRLDAGVVQPVMTSVDVGELVRRLALEYRSRAFARKLSMRCRSLDFHVRTDAVLLERILRNLLENSLRYTSRGGILIGLRQRGDSVRLEVVDTGIGIPADMQAKIFEEFRQVENPGRDASKGLGLGLAIVSRLASLLGTEVQVRSRLGRGARFSLLLPIEKAAPVVVAMKAAVDNPGGRLLVIEDDAGVREAYEMMLGFSGYQVFCAETGEKALAIAAQEDWRFDAIIADQRLGSGLTGAATAKKICGHAGRAIPTMVVTGDTGKESLLEIYASGFIMLHKPVDADQLCGTLASLLSGGRGLPP
jgi:signal transduction histidine kinase/ActR/RegA family two-component response regulator